MLRIRAGVAVALLVGGALALLVGACGGSRPSTGSSRPSTGGSRSTTTASATAPAPARLTVSPPAPTTRSRVTFAFRAPASSGRHGSSRLTFTLNVAGPRRPGCLGPRTVPVQHVVRARRASVTPPGGWCAGIYVAEVQEFARPYCAPAQMCPQSIRLVATVARTMFRVAAG